MSEIPVKVFTYFVFCVLVVDLLQHHNGHWYNTGSQIQEIEDEGIEAKYTSINFTQLNAVS
jgi:hypothetical protein